MLKFLSGVLIFCFLSCHGCCKSVQSFEKSELTEQSNSNFLTKEEFLQKLGEILEESKRAKIRHDKANSAPLLQETLPDINVKEVGDVKEKDIEKALSYFNKAKNYQNENAVDKAVTNYKLAIKSNPDFLEAYGNLGIIYAEKGDYKKSTNVLKKYLKLANNPEEKKLVKEFTEKMNKLIKK